MDYNHINGFFDKFKQLIFQKTEIKEIIKKTISENIFFEITDDFFDYKNGIIYLKCSPVVRNEIIMRKEKILTSLKEQLNQNTIVLDIK